MDDIPDGASDADDAVRRAEGTLLSTLREMLGLPHYLFPLAAAQRQYRLHYYGLSSAALLEDLFHDSLANYLAQYRPEVRFERPGRGQKGWDYRFEGLPVSHKVGLKAQPIAALWDATVKAETWSFDSPVVFVSAGYSPPTGAIVSHLGRRRVRPVSGAPTEQLKPGNRVWLVRWPEGGQAEVLWTALPSEATTVGAVASFASLWPTVAAHLRAGRPANELELLRSTAREATTARFDAIGAVVGVEFAFRSGINFFPRSSLQNVPVKSNNRALLMSAATVEQKMVEAVTTRRFVPMPLWFGLFAGTRPPDLFLSQQAEYEGLFSPARRPAAPMLSPVEEVLSELF